MKFLLLTLVVVLSITGCKSNPYDGKANLQDTDPKKPVEKKPGQITNFGLEAPDVMEFVEGELGEYIVRGAVPTPGMAIIEIENLPKGMKYDPITFKLSWIPGFTDGDDPANLKSGIRTYKVSVQVSSDLDSLNVLSKNSVIIVKNNPRKFEIAAIADATQNEGKELVQTVSFQDLDFPKGPFIVQATGLPALAEVVYADNTQTQFRLVFTAPYNFVIQQGTASTKQVLGSVFVTNPAGVTITKSFKWLIRNETLQPVVAGPRNILSETSDVYFTIISEDLNGEEYPKVSVVRQPNFGNFNIVNEFFGTIGGSLGNNPKTATAVSWKNIPTTEMGKTHTLSFNSCVGSTSVTTGKCGLHAVSIKIPPAPTPTPTPTPTPEPTPFPMPTPAFVPQVSQSLAMDSFTKNYILHSVDGLELAMDRIQLTNTSSVQVLKKQANCQNLMVAQNRTTGKSVAVVQRCFDGQSSVDVWGLSPEQIRESGQE